MADGSADIMMPQDTAEAGPSRPSSPKGSAEPSQQSIQTVPKTHRGNRTSGGPQSKPVVAKRPIEPHLRTTRIRAGDNVLLRLPSGSVKAVVAAKEGLVQLGKFGGFPAQQLIGAYFDITYEMVKSEKPNDAETPDARDSSNKEADAAGGEGSVSTASFGQMKSLKHKNKGKGKGKGSGPGHRTNPAWGNELRPFKSRALVDAVIDDIQETNEFIDDSEEIRTSLMSHEEIAKLKAEGISAEEMMKRQMERHDTFDLKTNFSKEKWRKRKEKKFSQTIHPIAPTAANICSHYLTRSPQSTMHLREDTLGQLLTLSNIRPGGRYLVVDDTGGLVTAAVLERMGCEGRILTFVDADSPPAWGVLSTMNWSADELACIKWLSWLEAEEDYEKPPLPDEDVLPAVAAHKTHARQRKHNLQVAELNGIRDELHLGHWDGLVVASQLSPLSVLARLTTYLSGSATIAIYSPYVQPLVDVLGYTKKNPNYLAENLSESWTRTYQVLPGRTHPLMMTSATGGYLFHALRVLPSPFEQNLVTRKRKRKSNKPYVVENGVEGGEDASSDHADPPIVPADAAAAGDSAVGE